MYGQEIVAWPLSQKNCRKEAFRDIDNEHFSFCACYLRGSILPRRMGKCQDKNDDVEVSVVAVLYVVAFLL